MTAKAELRPDVRLAPLSLSHAERMARWMDDPIVAANVGLRGRPSLERSGAWVNGALQDESIRPFAILLGEEHVGNVVLDRIDRFLLLARLHIYVGEVSARSKGVGAAATHLALQQAFEVEGLHKVWLTVHCRNAAALRTYLALGFSIEGVLRDEFVLEGKRVSAFYMGLLAHEFVSPG